MTVTQHRSKVVKFCRQQVAIHSTYLEERLEHLVNTAMDSNVKMPPPIIHDRMVRKTPRYCLGTFHRISAHLASGGTFCTSQTSNVVD